MRTILLILLLAVLGLSATSAVEAETTILYTANSYGEYLPCPS